MLKTAFPGLVQASTLLMLYRELVPAVMSLVMACALPIPTGMFLMLNQDFGTAFLIVLQEPRGNSLIALEFCEKLAEMNQTTNCILIKLY